jgi:small conductance mechanosensitive channel
VTIAYGTDIDQATEVVDAVGRAMAADPTWKRRVLEAPKVDRVAALGEYGITLKILGTVRAPDQWAAAGELRKRLLAAFREHGIEIPRPQRVVLAREPDGLPAAENGLVPGDDAVADAIEGD